MSNKVNCPHCEKATEVWGPTEDNEFFWCNFCAGMSLYEKRVSTEPKAWDEYELRKPSEQEELAIHNAPDDSKIKDSYYSKMWLPSISKDNIHFEIMIVKDGTFNEHILMDKYDFTETERYLKLALHKFDVMPQVGDVVKANSTNPDRKVAMHEELDFVIVGRQFGCNGYEDVLLFVVEMEKWLQKLGY